MSNAITYATPNFKLTFCHIRSVICDTMNTIIAEQDTRYSILVFKIKVTKIRLLIYMLIYIIEHLTLDLSDRKKLLAMLISII
jgi:hypothetical protein